MSISLLDRRIVETTSQEALHLLEDLLKSSREFSIVGEDLDGSILFWNEGARLSFGYTEEEVIGRENVAILEPPRDDLASRSEEIREIAVRDGKWEGVLAQRRRSGEVFESPVTLVRCRDGADGKITVLRVASARSAISEALEAGKRPVDRAADDDTTNQSKFHNLLESSPDAVVIMDHVGRIVLVNSRAEQLFGYGRDELVGRPIETLVPEQYRQRHPEHRAGYAESPKVRSMGTGGDLYGQHKDGREFPVEISLSPIDTPEGPLVGSFIRDISARKRFETELQEKNIELEKANRAKDYFLASMSHELRTPLNAIIGFTGTLLMRLPGPLTPDQERQLQTVRTSARHLLSLINDLLDLAKIESGKVELTLEPVVSQAVIGEVATALRPAAEVKGLKFVIDMPREEMIVSADRRALNQILINLTNNAIKFTDHGEVRLSLARRVVSGARWMALAVADTGVGIRIEDQEKLFHAFTQVNRGGKRRNEGAGLGLHLSQKLATLLGGRIDVQSEFGSGSVFTLMLPEG